MRRFSKLISLLLFIQAFLSPIFANSENAKFINTEITLLAPEVLYSSNIQDVESMSSWSAIVSQLLEEISETHASQNVAIFQIILSKDKEPEIDIITESPISEELSNEYKNTILAITPPEIKYGKMAFRISTMPRNISRKRLEALHQTVLPYLHITIERFRVLPLQDKILFIEEWSREEALPVLTDYAKLQYSNSTGIQSLASLIDKNIDQNKIPIQEFVTTNPLYWRAVFEMPADKPLAPTIELIAHAGNGSIDLAKRLLNITLPFSSIQNPSGFYLDQLATYLHLLQQDIAQEIQQIRDLKNAKRFQDAIIRCERLLTYSPGQPIVLHEYIQLNILQRQDQGEEVSLKNVLTEDLLDQIYSKDPFFLGSTIIRSARDAYNHIKRSEIDQLFKSTENYRENLITLAKASLQMKVWSFSAHLYHRALYYTESNESGKNDIIEHFLYALEQMGITDFKSNFPGDHELAFKNIYLDLDRDFKSSDVYKGFQGVNELD